MRRAVITLLGVLAVILVIAFLQWRSVSARIDSSRWEVQPLASAPFLTDDLAPRVLRQSLLGGRAHLEFFLRLLTQQLGSEDSLGSVRARVFVTGHAWADVLFADHQGRRCAFRLSRSPGMPSGFLRWKGGALDASREVRLGQTVVVPGDAIAPARRQELMIWSFNQPHEAFGALKRDALGRWFTVEVRTAAGGIEALVDNEVVGKWTAVTEIRGPVGVAAGDLPCVYVDSFEARGPDGAVLLRDGFGGSAETSYRVFGALLVPLGLGLLLWGAAVGFAPWIFPGIDRAQVGLRLVRALWPLVAVPLVGWWWGPVENETNLAFWWIAAGVLTALAWLGVFLASRRMFRWRAVNSQVGLRAVLTARWGEGEGARGPRLFEALVVALLLGILPLVSFVWGDHQGEGTSSLRFRQEMIDAPQTLSEGAHVESSRTSGRVRARLTARLRLLEPGTRVELYLLDAERELYHFRPAMGVHDWYALRLSDDPQACGLIVSDRPPRHPAIAPLTVGEEVSVEMTIRGSRLTARLGRGGDAGMTTWDTLRDGRFARGSAGFVVRSGSAEVSALALEGIPPIAAAEETAVGRLHTWWQRGPSQLVSLALGVVLAAWLLSAALLAAVGACAPQPILRLSAVAWGAGVIVALLVFRYVHSHEVLLLTGWSQALALWLGLLTAAALLYLLWIINADGLRRFHVVSLVFVILLVVLAEQVVRATPLGYSLQSRRTPGYVRNLFVFSANEAPDLWMTYTGHYEFPRRGLPGWDQECPIEKPRGAIRVFCVGGSSTWGAGVSRVEDSYPWLLEDRLRANHPGIGVFNAGHLAHTLFDDLLLLKRDLVRLSPDVITLYVGANDGYPAWWTGGEPLEASWRAINAVTGRGLLGRLGLWLPRQRLFVGLNRLIEALRPFPSRLAVEVPPERFEANLREFAAICRARGIGLVLVHEVMVEDLHLAHPSHAAYHEILDRVGRELGLPVIDPRPLFRAHLNDGWLVDPVHPSPAGNRALADLMAPAVERQIAERVGSESATPETIAPVLM